MATAKKTPRNAPVSAPPDIDSKAPAKKAAPFKKATPAKMPAKKK